VKFYTKLHCVESCKNFPPCWW